MVKIAFRGGEWKGKARIKFMVSEEKLDGEMKEIQPRQSFSFLLLLLPASCVESSMW